MIYLATPYTHPDPRVEEQRFVEACRIANFYMLLGDMIFSHIVHCHPIATRFKMPTNHEFWLAYNKHFLSLSELLRVAKMPGWANSRGVNAEIIMAREANISVEFVEP